MVKSESAPPRKYYQLTADAKKTLAEWKRAWSETTQFVDSILEKEMASKLEERRLRFARFDLTDLRKLVSKRTLPPSCERGEGRVPTGEERPDRRHSDDLPSSFFLLQRRKFGLKNGSRRS